MIAIQKKDTYNLNGSVFISKARNTGGLVLIKADWCGHCKAVIPELSKVYTMTGNSFPIFVIDSDASPDLVKDLGVNSFPTMFFIGKNGEIGENYNGGRQKNDFIKSICSKARVCF